MAAAETFAAENTVAAALDADTIDSAVAPAVDTFEAAEETFVGADAVDTFAAAEDTFAFPFHC